MSAILSFDPEHSRTLFDLVVATLWADGEVADREFAAARGAQIALGLVHESDDARVAVARGARERWRGLARAGARDRVLAYAAAVWTALADGRIDPGEARFLREVRTTLALEPGGVALAEGLARYVDAASRAERAPFHRAFTRLLREGARRLEVIHAHLGVGGARAA